ncbi:teicoplanin resistance protein VanZ [Ferrigenium kumadai]|uniref:Teicoplanin resistance protein VanZ n=1 Tax=Ferrigenium kumadai TaxID=1682490 RepID=A0AAN1T1S1_9PROT|nr:VanZ family protein [Ferrigenium kumadai]BBJ00516.1 teicoplanin resistance protein VanZ [Ferrigenium kumadai]
MARPWRRVDTPADFANTPLPMKEIFITETRARLRTWLALGYVLFIVYASLSPFSGWQEQGLDFAEVLGSPLRLTYTAFDATINLLSYLPVGLLIGLALRARLNATASVIISLGLGIALSASMEYLQMYLPSRISSNTDLLTNSLGTLIGALLAVSITSWPWLFSRLLHWRSRLFHHGKEMDFGLALLVLWMFGQINPSLPMLGNVFISEVARQPFAVPAPAPFDPWESGAVTLNLLMLGTLLLTLLRVPRNVTTALLVVLSTVALAKFVTAAMLLKSWALLLWINGEAMVGMLLGMLLLIAVMWLPRAAAITLGALAAVGHFIIANFVSDQNSPAAAASIYHWHYGHLLNYNGLAQTITLAFPLLLLWHLWRIKKV